MKNNESQISYNSDSTHILEHPKLNIVTNLQNYLRYLAIMAIAMISSPSSALAKPSSWITKNSIWPLEMSFDCRIEIKNGRFSFIPQEPPPVTNLTPVITAENTDYVRMDLRGVSSDGTPIRYSSIGAKGLKVNTDLRCGFERVAPPLIGDDEVELDVQRDFCDYGTLMPKNNDGTPRSGETPREDIISGAKAVGFDKHPLWSRYFISIYNLSAHDDCGEFSSAISRIENAAKEVNDAKEKDQYLRELRDEISTLSPEDQKYWFGKLKDAEKMPVYEVYRLLKSDLPNFKRKKEDEKYDAKIAAQRTMDKMAADLNSALASEDWNRAAGILDKLLSDSYELSGNIFEIAAIVYDETKQYAKKEQACARGKLKACASYSMTESVEPGYDRKSDQRLQKKLDKILNIAIPVGVVVGGIYMATQQQAQREAEERKKAEEEARRKQVAHDAENARRRAQGLPTLEEEEQRRWQEQQAVRDRTRARCLENCDTQYYSCMGDSDPKCCTDFCLVTNCPSICSSVLASCRRDCD